MDLFGTKKKSLEEQTPGDLMRVLKQEAMLRLGSRWVFFKKIRAGKEGFSFLKEAKLVEKMKATRAALIFSARNTRKNYRLVYKTAIADVRRFAQEQDFPAVEEVPDGQPVPSITPQMDGIIISWTPIKFLLPAKLIREKGRATQRHTEGLIAKLYFKVAAYYAVPKNWEKEKLTLYMRKITPESNFQEVSTQLKNLKADLEKFGDIYIAFRFGTPSRSKDIPSDLDAYEEMVKETPEQQVSDLYWYNFIYKGLEQFLFHYYLTNLEVAPSIHAIRALNQIFFSAISKAIELHHVFLGSFETDRAKRAVKSDFVKYIKERESDPPTHEIKLKDGIYESYSYNLSLLDKSGLSYEVPAELDEDSEWGRFLGGINEQLEKERQKLIENPPEVEVEDAGPVVDIDQQIANRRNSILLQIMGMMLKCSEFKIVAKEKVLDRLKRIMKVDRDLATKRVEELKKRAEKEVRLKKRKLIKMKAAKQNDMLALLEQDLEKFNKEVEEKSKQIENNAQVLQAEQKKRGQAIIESIEVERKQHAWKSARRIFDLAQKVFSSNDFKVEFIKFLITTISEKYDVELELFYQHMFKIVEPDSREKMTLIQAVEKSGGENAIKLSLDKEDIEAHKAYLANIQNKINQMMPGVFKMKIVLGNITVPIEDVVSLSLDNASLHVLATLKIQAPNKPFFKLRPDIIRALLLLNQVSNPIPKHNLIIPERANDKNPEKKINTTLLNKILAELAEEEKNLFSEGE